MRRPWSDASKSATHSATVYTARVANSRTQAYTFPAPPAIVFGHAFEALQTTFGNVAQVGPTSLSSNAKLSFLSWGEKIAVEVLPNPSGCTVTVTSRSALGTQIFDWGVHSKNIEKVFAAVAGADAARRPV